MMQSMTAFASRTGALDGYGWSWDMRGVNGRGLDLRIRVPDGLGGLEQTLRTALKAAIHRGNVTVTLRLNTSDAVQALALDDAQLDMVLSALGQIAGRAQAAGVTLAAPSAAEVLTTRGVMRNGAAAAEGDNAALVAALSADIAPLLSEFTKMRTQEGAALQRMIATHLDRITGLIDDAAAAIDARRPQQREALREAYARVLAEVTEADEARLAQELALLAVKQDVTEEIDRLRAHVAAAWELLEGTTPAGRKLDFLAQEFNREANTLCAKSQNAALTAIGLELKAAIDQMREQIQNVE